MKNCGKQFEEDFMKSVPDYALKYRLPDSAQSFDHSDKLRFSRKSPFDYELFDSKKRILYALELKTVKGKSISFERTKEDKGDIHFHQIRELNNWNKYDGTVCGFIIEFRQLEKTFFLDIEDFNKLSELVTKKSFSNDDLLTYEIPHTIISQQKKRTRSTYDVDTFLNSMNA